MIFRIITTMSIKLDVCWDAAPCGLVQTDRGLRHHHHTTRHTNPEDNHLYNINVCSSNNALTDTIRRTIVEVETLPNIYNLCSHEYVMNL